MRYSISISATSEEIEKDNLTFKQCIDLIHWANVSAGPVHSVFMEAQG